MKKFVYFFIFIFYSIFLSINISYAEVDKNLGLYGFYLGQTFPDIVKNASEKGYTDISYISTMNELSDKDVDNIKDIIKNNTNTSFSEVSINRFPSSISGEQKVKSMLHVGLGKDIFKEFKNAYDSITLLNMEYNKNNDKFDKKISIDMCKFMAKNKPEIIIYLLRDNNNFSDSKVVIININITKNISDEVLNVLKDRYGNFKIQNVSYNKYPYWNINESYIYFDGLAVYFICDKNIFNNFINYYTNLYNSFKNKNKSNSLEGI